MIRENSENIRKMLKDRTVEFDLDSLLDLDEKRRKLIISTDDLRKRKNEMSLKITDAKKANKDANSQIQEMQSTSQELTRLEEDQDKTEADYQKLAFSIPNLLHESVPIGPDDSAIKKFTNGEKSLNLIFRSKDTKIWLKIWEFLILKEGLKQLAQDFTI